MKPYFHLRSIPEYIDEDIDNGIFVSQKDPVCDLKSLMEDKEGNNKHHQQALTNRPLPPLKFMPPPGLPMPPAIVQVNVPIVLPFYSKSNWFESPHHSPEVCNVVSNDDPWYLSPLLAPELPSMNDAHIGINSCKPCIDGQLEQENMIFQNHDVNVLFPHSFSFPSVGSMKHGTGNCKPCDWFWKPQGCKIGQACKHCHICPRMSTSQKRAINRKLSQIKPR